MSDDTNVEGGWGTDESSGFLRHFTGTVKDPFFGTNPKIGDGRTLLLHWPVTIEEVQQDGLEDQVGEEETILFSCGKDWETPDGGETAVHSSGNTSKLFHASSAMGMLIDAILGKVANYGENASRTDGDELVVDMGDAISMLRSRGAATDAATWDGLRWQFAEVLVDYGKDKEGEPIVSKRALPIKYLGVAGDDPVAAKAKPAKAQTAAQKKAAEAKAKKAAAASNGDSNSSSDPLADIEMEDSLRATLVEIAGAADDAESFQGAALDDNDVIENADLLDLIVDDEAVQGVYEALVG